MDDNTIFDKTPAGDEAVRERARLVQRNLRMVLIIVDGRADVAELKRKGGDPLMVASALADLERMGLIVPIESVQPAAPVSADGVGEASEPPAPEEPVAEPPAPELPPPLPEPEPLPLPLEAPTPVVRKAPPGRGPSLLAVLRRRWRELRQRRRVTKEDAGFEQAFEEESAVEFPPVAAAPKKPKKRPPRQPLSWRQIAGLAAGLVVVLLLAVLLFPYGIFRDRLERQAAALLGEPVKIAKVELMFSPAPSLGLRDVSVGAEGQASAGTVRLLPEFGSLFGEHWSFREVRIEGLRLDARSLGTAPRWFASQEGAQTIKRLTLADVSLAFGALQVAGLSGEMRFGGDGSLASVRLQSEDGLAHAEAVPHDGSLGVQVACTNWRAPFGRDLLFSSLELAGVAGPEGLRLDKIDAVAAGGRLQGKGSLEWNQRLALAAELSFKHADLAALLAVLGMPGPVSGPADGAMRLSCSGAGLGRLCERVGADGRFEVDGGSLPHLGLIEALRGNGRGATRFDRLAGTLVVTQDGARLDKLQLSSGALRADGWLEAGADGRLGGRLNVELRGAGGGRAVLSVTGTADDPLLKK